MSKPKNIENKELFNNDEASKRHTPADKQAKDGYQGVDAREQEIQRNKTLVSKYGAK